MTDLTILYVGDQAASRVFYAAVLGSDPVLDVPGMTEFTLGPAHRLGLMPVAGIRRLIGDVLPDPTLAAGIPRCELYLTVPDARGHHGRAIAAGALELSAMAPRDWGDAVAYSMDPDGHVLAFAEADSVGGGSPQGDSGGGL